MKKLGKWLIYFLKCIAVAVLVFSGSLMIAIAFEHIWPGVRSRHNPFVDGNAVENAS